MAKKPITTPEPEMPWQLVKMYETERKRQRQTLPQTILMFHEMAALHPAGSAEWRNNLAWAHQVYLWYREGKRSKGRPKETRDLDDFALAHMDAASRLTGEKNYRKLARDALAAGQTPKTENSVDRLARKFGALRRKPRPLNLSISGMRRST